MIELKEPKQFQWDHGNKRKSSDKHNVSKEETEQVFFNQPLLLLADKTHSQKEMRFHALGRTDNNRKLHISLSEERIFWEENDSSDFLDWNNAERIRLDCASEASHNLNRLLDKPDSDSL